MANINIIGLTRREKDMDRRKRVERSAEKFRRPYARWTSERERVGQSAEMDEGVEKELQKSEVRRILCPTDGVYAEIFSRASKLEIERRALEKHGEVRARIKKRR